MSATNRKSLIADLEAGDRSSGGVVGEGRCDWLEHMQSCAAQAVVQEVTN